MPLSVPQGSSPAAASSLSAGTVKETSPAFQGASRAFNASAAASTPSFTGANGAFAPAASSNVTGGGGGGGGRSQPPTSNESRLSVGRHNTGQSIARSRDVSPSHLAANFAASQASTRLTHLQSFRRPSPLQKMPTGTQLPAADQEGGNMPRSPATQSLVQLYESKQQKPGLQKTQSVRYVTKPGPPIRSPKPVRPLVGAGTASGVISTQSQTPTAIAKPQTLLEGGGDAVVSTAGSKPVDIVNQTMIATEESTNKRREPPQAPPPRRQQQNMREKPSDELEQSPGRFKSPADLSTARNQSSPGVIKESRSMSSVFPKYQPPSDPSIPPLPPPTRSTNPSASPARSLPLTKPPPHAIARQTSSNSTSSHLSIDSLATAMVASSLASSRNPSPTASAKSSKSLPPPPPRRHHSLFHHHHNSRTPSPPKQTQLRHTLRKHTTNTDSDSDSASTKHSRKNKTHHHLVRKHQHKHHEGDRKRYRTQVTERERKRYEGVWAANKGLLMPTPAALTKLSPQTSLSASASATSLDPAAFTTPATATATCYSNSAHTVLNVIVRDIYRRSRLPDDVLEEVWDLVTSGAGGGSVTVDRLGREEFVVGLWLIDQRLRGNKLPAKVGESVWASVRRLPGLRG